MTGDDDEEIVEGVIKESIEMDDSGSPTPPEGQKCERCDRTAVASPGDEWLCREYQKEFFRERHG